MRCPCTSLAIKLCNKIMGNSDGSFLPARQREWEFLFSGTLSDLSHGCMPRKVMMLLTASVLRRLMQQYQERSAQGSIRFMCEGQNIPFKSDTSMRKGHFKCRYSHWPQALFHLILEFLPVVSPFSTVEGSLKLFWGCGWGRELTLLLSSPASCEISMLSSA